MKHFSYGVSEKRHKNKRKSCCDVEHIRKLFHENDKAQKAFNNKRELLWEFMFMALFEESEAVRADGSRAEGRVEKVADVGKRNMKTS